MYSELSKYKNTGLITYNGLSINVDATKFDIGACSGVFVDPITQNKKYRAFAAQTAIDATYLLTAAGTFIGIDGTGAIVQQVEDFDRDQLSTVLRLGRLSHFGNTVITGTFDFPIYHETNLDYAYSVITKGTIKKAGLEIEANGTDLSLKRLAGVSERIGAGGTRDIANYPVSALAAGFSFIPAYNDTDDTAILQTTTTQIITDKYDDGAGALATVDDSKYTNLNIYFFPSETPTTFMIYGYSQFFSMTEARETAGKEKDFFVPTDIRGGVLLATISVKKGITNLTSAIANGTAFITLSNSAGVVAAFVPDLLNVIPVNFASDLPAPVGGEIRLIANTRYNFAGYASPLSLSDDLVFEDNVVVEHAVITTSGQIKFEKNALLLRSRIIHTGTAETFYSADSEDGVIRIEKLTCIRTDGNLGTSKFFNLNSTDPTGLYILDNIALIAPNDVNKKVEGGYFSGAAPIIHDVRGFYLADGFYFNNCYIGLNIDTLNVELGLNQAGTHIIDMQGTIAKSSLNNLLITPKQNEKIFNIDSGLTFNSIIITNSPFDLSESGVTTANIFETGSLDQTTVGVKALGNIFLPDSTAFKHIKFTGNTETTTVTLDNTPYDIAANWLDIENERFTMLTKLEYSSQTSDFTVGQTVTGSANSAQATIIADDDQGTSGTLTTVMINTNKYQAGETISDGLGGSATLDKVYVCLRYDGVEEAEMNIQTSVVLDPVSAAATSWTVLFAKNGTVDRPGFGFGISGNATATFNPFISVKVITDDEICLRVERNSGAGNVVVTDGRTSMTKV